MLNKEQLFELAHKARLIREDIIRSLEAAGSGHLGGSLGLADVFTYLYFSFLRHEPENPTWPNRDRLILSIGHVAPVLYASLAHAGYFPTEELRSLRKLGSRLQGHPGKEHGLPGIELSAGSLGQGLSVSVGIALGGKLNNMDSKTVCIMGDGEIQEGSIWEAAMSASHYKLNNLIALIDRNYCQIDGRTEQVMSLEPLVEKWKAFSWEVIEADGNSIISIDAAFCQAEKSTDKPVVIIAKTLMGKGVASIEDNYKWHGKVPNAEEAAQFINELNNSL